MTVASLLTAQDVFDYATKYLEGHSVSASLESLKWALHNAYQEVGQSFDWAFLNKQGRLFLHEIQDDGTIAYDHTGGTYERQVTLTGDTFPSWAEGATIRIDDVPCVIDDVKSTTVATLDEVMNPGADEAAGASYSLYPRCYTLPNDCQSIVSPWTETLGWDVDEVSYDELMRLDRHYDESGTPRWFCIRAVEGSIGSMGLYLHPPSDEEATIDFIYRRRAREVRYTGHDRTDYQGTIAVTAGSATVTGTGTAFSSLMVGSVFRIATSTRRPTGLRGDTPWVEERKVTAVASATSLTLDDEVDTTRSGVAYVVSDPVDVDPSLHQLILLGTVKHLAYDRKLSDLTSTESRYEQALQRARFADNRSTQRSVAGFGSRGSYRRLKDTSAYTGED